jgi:predicted DNA-binding protein
MPTAQAIVSIVASPELRDRLRKEARRRGKTLSTYVREVLEREVPREKTRRLRKSALERLEALADGELAFVDIDRELYGS